MGGLLMAAKLPGALGTKAGAFALKPEGAGEDAEEELGMGGRTS